MGHTLYVQVLTVVFLFWNSARIFTCLHTRLQLRKNDVEAQRFSLTTWAVWVLSNLTFALMLVENNRNIPPAIVAIDLGNTVVCLVTGAIVVRLKYRAKAIATKRAIRLRG